MKDVLQQADEIPVTLLVAIAYVTMAFLTNTGESSNAQLHQHGWLLATLVCDGEPWRLLTYAFLHGGWLHLGFNTYILLSFGPSLERSIGSLKMAALYLISALGGALAVCFYNHPVQPVVGGSGALFGMFGAIVALQMRQTRSTLGFLDYDGPKRILTLIGINLLIGAVIEMISNTAHVGGLVTGFAFAFLFMTGVRATDKRMLAWRVAFVALLTSLLLYTIYPVARWDWLWREAQATSEVTRRDQLLRAATQSYRDTTKITTLDPRVLQAQMESIAREIDELNKR